MAKTKDYLVTWRIDIDATSHEDAAQQAKLILQDPGNTAWYFSVKEKNKKNAKVKGIDADWILA